MTVASTGPTAELYRQLALQAGVNIHRLRLTKGSDGSVIPNSKDLLVDTTGLRQQSTVYVKDLGTLVTCSVQSFGFNFADIEIHTGPQIAWRTVFLIEYLGPLLIHPLCYFLLPDPEASYLQTLTLAMVLLHFTKREFETLFVHRFSAATMPAFNIFKNSAHYWLLSGLNMAYWIYLPSASAAKDSDPWITYPGIAFFVIGELANLSDHLTLRNLRSSGGNERGIPQGLGFDLVTCPNYMFEALAWTGIVMVSWSWSTVLFAVVAIAQMGVWAKKKEARYRKDFGGKYQKKRYTMIPMIW